MAPPKSKEIAMFDNLRPAFPLTDDTGLRIPSVRVGLPYGGDTAVARSMLAVHVRARWTDMCRGCREHYPCRERRDSQFLLGASASPPQSRIGRLSVPLLIGLLLVASVMAGLVAW
jgi:hypothetical protein